MTIHVLKSAYPREDERRRLWATERYLVGDRSSDERWRFRLELDKRDSPMLVGQETATAINGTGRDNSWNKIVKSPYELPKILSIHWQLEKFSVSNIKLSVWGNIVA